MFGWFKKQPEQTNAKETEAYKMGQEASQAMTAAVDDYMTARFEPVFKNYLGVLNGCLDRVYKPDAPPIVIARVEFQNFRENVVELRATMLDEINVTMWEWIDLSEHIGSRDVFDKYIVHVVNEYQNRLTMAGFQLTIDRADELKTADDKWRRMYPGKAAQFPPDN